MVTRGFRRKRRTGTSDRSPSGQNTTTDGGYRANFSVEDLRHGKTLIAYESDGRPVEADHGDPVRLLDGRDRIRRRELPRAEALDALDARVPQRDWLSRGGQRAAMKPIAAVMIAAGVLASVVAITGYAEVATAPVYVKKIPAGYRDWRLISVAHEKGDLNDLRAILGNNSAIRAYRAGKVPFPEGTIIARLAWNFEASEENNKAFGQEQSFIAGAPKNGVQFMVKDSKKYAATSGWGYGHFDDGKPADDAVLDTCFPCHEAVKERDYVFTRYSR